MSVHGSLTVSGDAAGTKKLLVSPTNADANLLDLQTKPRTNLDKHPKRLALYITANDGYGSADDTNRGGLEVRSTKGNQGIGIGHSTIYAAGSDENQNLWLKAKGTGSVQLSKRTDKDFDIHVAGGQEQLRMLREIVDKDGTKKAGAGFDVKKVAGKSGVYEITFNPAFSSTPAASANQIALGEILTRQIMP